MSAPFLNRVVVRFLGSSHRVPPHETAPTAGYPPGAHIAAQQTGSSEDTTMLPHSWPEPTRDRDHEGHRAQVRLGDSDPVRWTIVRQAGTRGGEGRRSLLGNVGPRRGRPVQRRACQMAGDRLQPQSAGTPRGASDFRLIASTPVPRRPGAGSAVPASPLRHARTSVRRYFSAYLSTFSLVTMTTGVRISCGTFSPFRARMAATTLQYA